MLSTLGSGQVDRIRWGGSTKFVHLFEFADAEAHETHGGSDAVRAFEAVYAPVLADGPVRFTDYELVARNTQAD